MVNQTSSAFVFRLYCPHATQVNVVGDFNTWSATATPMRKIKGDVWEARLQLAPGEYRFRYLINGSQWLTDYACGRVVPNAHLSWDSLAVVKPRETAPPAPRRRTLSGVMATMS